MSRYSDNLYSADSDDESMSDALSPTDGYFEIREHPSEMMVEDPSFEASSTAQSKAQEARRQSEARSQGGDEASITSPPSSTAYNSRPFTPSTTAAYTPSSPSARTHATPASPKRRSVDHYTESSSLLHPVAPPAYSPAVSPTTNTPAPALAGNYNTISSSQVEEGRVQYRQPESMGAPPADVTERTPLWTKQVKVSRTRKCMKNCLLVLLLAAVSLTLLVTIVRGTIAWSGGSQRGRLPNMPGSPGRPGNTSPYCRSAKIHKTGYPELEVKLGGELHVLQTRKDTRSSSGAYVQTNGKAIFRRLSEDHKDLGKGMVTFDVWTTDEDLNPEIRLDTNVNAIKAYTPQRAENLNPLEEHCISLEMTIWLPWNASFTDIEVYTAQLGIEVYDDIHVHAEHTASFEATSSSVRWPAIGQNDPTIKLPPFSRHAKESTTEQLFSRPERGITSRELRIHVASGSVKGAFSLYDLLSIHTLSGSIDVSVSPQKADANNKPAVLDLDSKSSSISAVLPTFANPVIPKRDYHTSVTSNSGSIKGSYYIGSECKISSMSSSMKVFLLPGLAEGNSHLITESYSGSTEIEILSPLSATSSDNHDDEPEKWINIGESDPYLLLPPLSAVTPETSAAKPSLDRFNAEHHSKSGSTKLSYPEEWQGRFTAKTYSGSIKVGGEGVSVISDGKEWSGQRRVIAKKGNEGDSLVDVVSASGSIDFWVG